MAVSKRIRHEKSRGKRKVPPKKAVHRLLKALPPKFKRETNRHTRLVKRVAEAIGKQLAEKGVKVDRGLLSRMALAHDSFRHEEGHERAAQTHFRDAGFPSFAKSMGRHASAKPERLRYYTLEERALIYADEVSRWNGKLGQESRHTVLPLEEAISNLVARYKDNPKMRTLVEREGKAIRAIEKELVRKGLDLSKIHGMHV